MADIEEILDMQTVTLRIPLAIYKWYRLAGEENNDSPETAMVHALVEDIRAWLETDDMMNFAYKKAETDGLHKVFKAYKVGIPVDFEQFLGHKEGKKFNIQCGRCAEIYQVSKDSFNAIKCPKCGSSEYSANVPVS